MSDASDNGETKRKRRKSGREIDPRELQRCLEGLLFASREPIPPARLAAALDGVATRDVRAALERMAESYRRGKRGFLLEEIAGGFRLVTVPDLAPQVRKLQQARSHDRLSPAALETLAIVAYRQPIIRADIEAIRGVACGGTLKLLMDRGLARITGRANVLGRPLLYGTTRSFLEQFGLNALEDLPRVDEFKRASR